MTKADVDAFYSAHPFPGYAPGDDGPTLIDRSLRAPFLVALDAAIPPDATVIDCGCGTGQLAAFLALAGPRRRVIALDGCMESLRRANAFRDRASIRNLHLVRADLFDLPLKERSSSVVICRGVVHHTPDPERAIACVARQVAPDGILLLGFYETFGRFFHRARRRLASSFGRPVRALDPVLRRADLDEEKKETWIADQYRHPLERCLALPRVVRVLDEIGLRWVRTIPPAPDRAPLFARTTRPSGVGMLVRRIDWLVRGVNDPDAGLVFVAAQRDHRDGVAGR